MAEHHGYWGGRKAEGREPTPIEDRYVRLGDVLDYVSSLNDMYRWNGWLVKRLRRRFGGKQ